jgi:hypothetical protein
VDIARYLTGTAEPRFEGISNGVRTLEVYLLTDETDPNRTPEKLHSSIAPISHGPSCSMSVVGSIRSSRSCAGESVARE